MISTSFGADKTKAARLAPIAASESSSKRLKYNTKKFKMLKLFTRLGESGLNCFQAANSHRDYVLRSTIADLQKNYGLEFSRKRERVPNAFGGSTDCVRYWLDEKNIIKAISLLEEEGAA